MGFEYYTTTRRVKSKQQGTEIGKQEKEKNWKQSQDLA